LQNMARIGKDKKENKEPKKPQFSDAELSKMDKEMKEAEKAFEKLEESEPEKAEAIRSPDYMWLYRMKAINVRDTISGYGMTVIPSNYKYYTEKLQQWKFKNEKKRYAEEKELEDYDKMVEGTKS